MPRMVCTLWPPSWGTVRVFRQNFTLEDAIGSHAVAPLEALSGVFVTDQCHSSRVSTFLTSSHCKLRPNTEGETAINMATSVAF
jgi:hypothetical protein